MTYSVFLLADANGTPCYYGRKPDGALGPGELVVNEGLTEEKAREIEVMLSKSLNRSRTLQ